MRQRQRHRERSGPSRESLGSGYPLGLRMHPHSSDTSLRVIHLPTHNAWVAMSNYAGACVATGRRGMAQCDRAMPTHRANKSLERASRIGVMRLRRRGTRRRRALAATSAGAAASIPMLVGDRVGERSGERAESSWRHRVPPATATWHRMMPMVCQLGRRKGLPRRNRGWRHRCSPKSQLGAEYVGGKPPQNRRSAQTTCALTLWQSRAICFAAR